MKLNSAFIIHDTGTESLLVPLGGTEWSGLVKGNKTLGAILELLQEDTTEEALVAAMAARFDAPREIIRRDVQKALKELGKIGAIDD